MSLGIVYRLLKGSPLTFEETDGNWRKLEDAYERLYRQFTSGTLKVLIQPDQPVEAERGNLWIKTDPTTGHGVGTYIWEDSVGKWTRVDDAPFFFQDTGSINALRIETGEGFNQASELTGRLFLIKVAQTNTGASFLVVDDISTQPIKRVDLTELIANDLKSGMILAVVYDGTQFQALNLAPQTITIDHIRPLVKATGEFTVPQPGASIPVPNPINLQPFFLRVVAVCQSDNTDGYMAGAEIDITGISSDKDDQEVDTIAFTVSADASNINVACTTCINGKHLHYTAKGGGDADFSAGVNSNPTKWKLKAYVF